MTSFDGVEWELVRLVVEKRAAEKAARVAFKKELARNLRVPWRRANPAVVPQKTPIAKQREYYRKARERVETRKIEDDELALFTARQLEVGQRIIEKLIDEGKLK